LNLLSFAALVIKLPGRNLWAGRLSLQNEGLFSYLRCVKKPYLVGISGGSASGKSSFIRHLKLAMPEGSVCVVSQDNYYLPIGMQKTDENDVVNFDLPESINRKGFFHDMQKLSKGEKVEILEYTFNNTSKAPETLLLEPAPILIMEGLYIFHFEEIKDSLDLKVFIDVRDEIKLQRRLLRDKQERGYPEDAVIYQWNHHVMPSYQRYLHPHRDDADIIVTNNHTYDKGLFVLVNHLKSILAKASIPV